MTPDEALAVARRAYPREMFTGHGWTAPGGDVVVLSIENPAAQLLGSSGFVRVDKSGAQRCPYIVVMNEVDNGVEFSL